MTYAETLDYLFTQLPMYQRQGGAALKKDLTNITALLAWLGNPHEKLRCVHVAGTNGKGTVSHLIAAGLQEQGYRVGMYTSPHYLDFRERIKINGTFIPEPAVTEFVERLRGARLSIEPSFFEITVALAFDYFAQQAPDFCVIEVGLGGRLDSTNVITPVLAVITNIGLDHTQFLGTTLPEIAGEKAGIIKPDVPTIIGRRQNATSPVFTEIANAKRSELLFAEDQFQLYDTVGHYALTAPANYRLFTEDEAVGLSFNPHPGLTQSAVQRENMVTALAALAELAVQGYLSFDPKKISGAWTRLSELTYYIGRFQTLERDGDGRPAAVADSAHNADGLREAVKWLAGFGRPLHIVLGVVADKDLTKILPLLPREATYYFAKADIPRGLPASALRAAAEDGGLRGVAYPSVAAAYTAAMEARDNNDLVFVGGSIFTVAEVL